MKMTHEVDAITLKTLFESARQLKEINITIDARSIENLKELLSHTIFWRS